MHHRRKHTRMQTRPHRKEELREEERRLSEPAEPPADLKPRRRGRRTKRASLATIDNLKRNLEKKRELYEKARRERDDKPYMDDRWKSLIVNWRRSELRWAERRLREAIESR